MRLFHQPCLRPQNSISPEFWRQKVSLFFKQMFGTPGWLVFGKDVGCGSFLYLASFFQFCEIPRPSQRSIHRYSVAFRSEDYKGHSKTFVLYLWRSSLVDFEVCLGSFSFSHLQPFTERFIGAFNFVLGGGIFQIPSQKFYVNALWSRIPVESRGKLTNPDFTQ